MKPSLFNTVLSGVLLAVICGGYGATLWLGKIVEQNALATGSAASDTIVIGVYGMMMPVLLVAIPLAAYNFGAWYETLKKSCARVDGQTQPAK